MAKPNPLINNLINTVALRYDEGERALDADLFVRSPEVYYKKILEKTFSQKKYDDLQNFYGVVISKRNITKNEFLAFFDEKEEGKPKYATGILHQRLETIIQVGLDINYYNVYIPDLESHMPTINSIDDPQLVCWTENSVSNIGFFSGNQEIGRGTIVEIKAPIKATKYKTPFEIIKILSKKRADQLFLGELLSFEFFTNKACPDPKLEVVANSTESPKTTAKSPPPLTDSPAIQTSTEFDAETAKIVSPLYAPVLSDRPPNQQTPDPPKKTVNKDDGTKTNKVNKECSAPTISAQGATQSNLPEPVANAVLINKKRIKEHEIVGTKFFHPESTEVLLPILNNDQEKTGIKPGRADFKASEDPNSVNPFIDLEEDFRNISMVVIKENEFIDVEDYINNIKETRQGAAHFCIDYQGNIYQFTDTKNLVKCYNPTIDDISIYISLLNISYLNSPGTEEQMRKSFSTISTVDRYTSDLNLKTKMLSDKFKLKSFYKRNNIQKEEDFFFSSYYFSDRYLLPNYRFDITKKQKEALKILLNVLKVAYFPDGLSKPKITGTFGYNPEIASGNASGVIVAPYFFNNSDSTFLSIYSNVEDIKGGS